MFFIPRASVPAEDISAPARVSILVIPVGAYEGNIPVNRHIATKKIARTPIGGGEFMFRGLCKRRTRYQEEN